MRHRNRFHKAGGPETAEALFERTLLGLDESTDRRRGETSDRKSLQLCRQVERALSLAISGECSDDALQDVHVAAVKPMGSTSQLLVCIAAPAGANVVAILDRLNHRSGRLRSIVAQAISRKRTPALSFVVVPQAGEGHD